MENIFTSDVQSHVQRWTVGNFQSMLEGVALLPQLKEKMQALVPNAILSKT